MMDGNHIYSLNNNVKRLEQMDDTNDDEHVIRVSSYFYVKDKDDEKPIYYKMIDTIDDIVKIIKEYKKEGWKAEQDASKEE